MNEVIYRLKDNQVAQHHAEFAPACIVDGVLFWSLDNWETVYPEGAIGHDANRAPGTFYVPGNA